MSHVFYPFVENEGAEPTPTSPQGGHAKPMADMSDQPLEARYPARIAVYDDAAAAPRVVVVEASDVRSYLEEVTATVVRLEKEQGGSIPFTVIREVVENYIHAYFIEPTISILDGGQTIRFSDQGPGIPEKDRALEYGTSSATEEMKRYIRGVGSGLPYAQQFMEDHGGSLTIEDNIGGGSIITISMLAPEDEGYAGESMQAFPQGAYPQAGYAQPQMGAVQMAPAQMVPAQPYPAPMPGYAPQGYPQQPAWPGTWQGAPMGAPTMGQGYGQPWPQQQMAPGIPAGMPGAQQAPMANPGAPFEMALSQRGWQILTYLMTHESVGGADLARTFGSSQPTWSRELKALEDKGLVKKQAGGQRRELTASGRSFIQQHPQG